MAMLPVEQRRTSRGVPAIAGAPNVASGQPGNANKSSIESAASAGPPLLHDCPLGNSQNPSSRRRSGWGAGGIMNQPALEVADILRAWAGRYVERSRARVSWP